MKKYVMVFGANGFAGSNLLDYLITNKSQYDIIAVVRSSRSDLSNVKHLLKHDKISWETIDITDANGVNGIIKKYSKLGKIEKCFALAALSYVPYSWENPSAVIDVNVNGQVNILEGFKNASPETTIMLCSSSESYGKIHPSEVPIKETNPLRPMSVYGISKVAVRMLAEQYFASYNMPVVCSVGFNHSGKRRGSCFATGSFAKQIALIEKGLQEPIIKHGNLEAKRDITDVSNMVKAYFLLTEDYGGEQFGQAYNICSENAFSMEFVLKYYIGQSSFNGKIKCVQNPDLMRPSDVPILLGDCSKFKKLTGFNPTSKITDVLDNCLKYYRKIV